MNRDNKDRVNIRVFRRTERETILIWNTQPLTDEQRQNWKVYIRLLTASKWILPEVAEPEVDTVKSQMDGNTDAIVIRHVGDLHGDTPFLAKFSFGTNEIKEAVVKVAGAGSAMPYVKPIRTKTGVYALPIDWPNLDLVEVNYGGRRIKALPVVLVGDMSGSCIVAPPTNGESLTKE